MNQELRLELNFETQNGRNKRINIREPKAGLTVAQLTPVMQAFIDTNIFEEDGEDLYATAKSARYVTTSTEEVFNAEPIA